MTHELGCSAGVGQRCTCDTIHKERAGRDHYSHHSRPVIGCLDCEDALHEARELTDEWKGDNP